MNSEEKAKNVKDYWPLCFFVFGSYLLAGAVVCIVNRAWPIFMPPQLDIIGFALSIFGEPLASLLSGVVLGLLGLGLIYLAYIVSKNEET